MLFEKRTLYFWISNPECRNRKICTYANNVKANCYQNLHWKVMTYKRAKYHQSNQQIVRVGGPEYRIFDMMKRVFPQTMKSMIIPKTFRVRKDSCLSVCLCSKQNIRMPVPHVLLFLTQHTSNCWYKWSGQVSSECQTIWCTTTKIFFSRSFVNRYMYKRMVKSESFLLSLNANFKLKRINFFHQIKQ